MKLKRKYPLFLLFSFLLFTFACIITVSAHTEEKTVRIGYYLFDSFQEINSDGEYSGYGFEYIYEISQYNAWKLEFKIGTIEECEEMLKNGEVDIIQGIMPTEARASYMNFSALPCSTSQSELYVSAYSDKYAYEDFASFEGMRVGILKNSLSVSFLDDYCKEHGFSIQKVEFNSQQEMELALNTEEIDGIFSSNISNFSDNKIVARFPKSSLYFGVRKGADNILEELNNAMKDIEENNPFFLTQLGNRYLLRGQTNNPAFTREELDYIKEKKVITCVYDPNWAPLEYYDRKTNQIQGINPAIFHLISEYTGLEFRYEPSSSFTEALQKVNSGKADMISCIYHDYNWADINNLYLTSSYLNFPVIMVSRNSSSAPSPKTQTVVLARSHYTSIQIAKQFADNTYLYCDNIEECFDMVRKGKADVTYVNLYVADHFLSDSKYYNLSLNFLANFQEQLSIGISRNSDPLLLSIINKVLACISDETINQIIFENTVHHNKLSFQDMIYSNPVQAIAYLVVLFVIVIAAFCYILISKERNNKKTNAFLKQSKLDNQRLTLAMQHILCQIFEYNMNENTITILNSDNSYNNLFLSPGVHSIAEISHILPDFQDNYFQIFHKIESGQTSADGTILASSIGGQNRWYQISMRRINYNEDSDSLLAIGTIEDITDEKLKTEFDFLTGLYTRGNAEKYINKRLEQISAFYDQNRIIDALFLLDLDHFKSINDTYGHMEGDALLKSIGSILSDSVQTADIAGRLGGDEFILYLQNLSDSQDAELKAQEVQERILSIAKTKPEWSAITVSIGIAYSPRDGVSFEKLYENADKALYWSKENGRNQYSIYEKGSGAEL